MSICLIIHEITGDDLLADWRKYCRARGMVFGGYPGEGAHTIGIVSTTHRLRLTIGQADGADPQDTLRRYLTDLTRRNPHLILTGLPDEAALTQRTQYEGTVGFIIDGPEK